MTLMVSVLVEDGIVLAGDSVAAPNILAAQETPEPTSTKPHSHSEKIFPFYERFGIGTWGQGVIDGKSVEFVMRELENKVKAEGICFNTVNEVALTIIETMRSLEWEGNSPKFFVAGYTEEDAEIVEVFGVEDIGPTLGTKGIGPLKLSFDKPGCRSYGETGVVNSIEKLYGKVSDPGYPPFDLFSLQTAIEYALFLIRTTIEVQKFSHKESTTGKTIDVAIVTHLEGFRWVQRKPLSAILQREEWKY